MSKLHEIELKARDKTEILTGRNCILTIDGKEIKGVTNASFKIDASTVGELTISVLGKIRVFGKLEEIGEEDESRGHSEDSSSTTEGRTDQDRSKS